LSGKNASDLEQFKKASKENFIPLLLIGKSISLKGFNESEWSSALDQAGYPKTNPLAPSQQTKPGAPTDKAPQEKPAGNSAAKPY